MTTDPRIQPASTRPIDGAGPVRRGGTESSDVAGGAAFRALLERLEKNAQDLNRTSESLDDPRDLGQVVENARASVEEALALGSDLLEAFRAAQQRAADGSSATQAPPNHDANEGMNR